MACAPAGNGPETTVDDVGDGWLLLQPAKNAPQRTAVKLSSAVLLRRIRPPVPRWAVDFRMVPNIPAEATEFVRSFRVPPEKQFMFAAQHNSSQYGRF
jgi:hypothetical protein